MHDKCTLYKIISLTIRLKTTFSGGKVSLGGNFPVVLLIYISLCCFILSVIGGGGIAYMFLLSSVACATVGELVVPGASFGGLFTNVP